MQKFLALMFLLLFISTISLPVLAQQEDTEEGLIIGYARMTNLNTLKQEVLPLLKPFEFGEREFNRFVADFERNFEFVGKGGTDWSRPAGFFFVFGKDYSPEQMGIGALPVKDGFGKVEQFDKPNKGPKARKVPGFDNARLINRTYFVRVPGYIFFSPNKKVLALQQDPMWSTFESDPSLFSFYMDGKKLNEEYPGAIQEFLNKIAEEKGTPSDPAEQFGQKIALQAMEALAEGQSRLAIFKTSDSLQLKFDTEVEKVSGMELGTAKGLPESLLFQSYLNSTEWLVNEFLPVVLEQAKNEAPLEAEDSEAIFDIFQKFCQSSRTASLGINFESDEFTVYVVKENPEADNDDNALVRQFIEKVNEIDKKQRTEDLDEDLITIKELDSAKAGNVGPGMIFSSKQGDGCVAFFQIANYSYMVGTNGSQDSLYKAIQKLSTPGLNFSAGSLFIYSRVRVGAIAKLAATEIEEPQFQKWVKGIPKDANIALEIHVDGSNISGVFSIPLSLFQMKKPK